MQILVIDDDCDTCDILRRYLEKQGFDIACYDKGTGIIELIHRMPPNLIILDVVLPDTSGQDLCKHIRDFSDIPIMMISAIAKENLDMVEGLNLGADDYLIKPLNLSLLLARINALFRRTTITQQSEPNPYYSDNYLTIDLKNQLVRIEGEYLALTQLEYQLLELLMCSANSTLSALELNESLWPGQAHSDGTANLRAYIRRLRQLIEKDPANPRYIITEHGFGYRFVTQ